MSGQGPRRTQIRDEDRLTREEEIASDFEHNIERIIVGAGAKRQLLYRHLEKYQLESQEHRNNNMMKVRTKTKPN